MVKASRSPCSLYAELSLPSAPKQILSRLMTEYDEAISYFMKGLPENKFVDISEGELTLSKVESLKSVSDTAKGFLETILPKIRIEDILLEVHRKIAVSVYFPMRYWSPIPQPLIV